MDKLKDAELYAKEKHLGMVAYDGKTPYWKHLEGVVNRLKNLGVADDDTLCAAWLHGTIDDTNVIFDDINQRFGRKVAVMVLSLSQDRKVPKKESELQYIQQLKNAPLEAQLIKLCKISSSFKDLKNSSWSRTKKTKIVKKKLHYLNVIRPAIVQSKSKFPGIQPILDGINDVLVEYRQRPVAL
jgi:(p)ppGpp synthase/HD superfamily hydrolase